MSADIINVVVHAITLPSRTQTKVLPRNDKRECRILSECRMAMRERQRPPRGPWHKHATAAVETQRVRGHAPEPLRAPPERWGDARTNPSAAPPCGDRRGYKRCSCKHRLFALTLSSGQCPACPLLINVADGINALGGSSAVVFTTPGSARRPNPVSSRQPAKRLSAKAAPARPRSLRRSTRPPHR
jgi:hypothetical protein